jgi:hypothetical protein
MALDRFGRVLGMSLRFPFHRFVFLLQAVDYQLVCPIKGERCASAFVAEDNRESFRGLVLVSITHKVAAAWAHWLLLTRWVVVSPVHVLLVLAVQVVESALAVVLVWSVPVVFQR